MIASDNRSCIRKFREQDSRAHILGRSSCGCIYGEYRTFLRRAIYSLRGKNFFDIFANFDRQIP